MAKLIFFCKCYI